MEIIDLALKTLQSGHDFSIDLEDIGQVQRSSHGTHFLMLVIICTNHGKNPSRTVDATEQTRFWRPRPNDLGDTGQGQRSLYATHPLILVIICAKYGKNPARTADFFFKVLKSENFKKLPKNLISRSWIKAICETPFNDSDHLCQIYKESIQNCRRYREDTVF